MARRLRVLFVIGTMSGGGAERQVIEILRRIDRSRFEPLLYLAIRTGELLDQVPSDVPVFAYQDPRVNRWWQRMAQSLKLSPLVRYLHLAHVLSREQIDVVYDRTYRATLDAAGATRFRPTPRISCCVVDPQPELELQAGGPNRLLWCIARSAYRRANLVLANSDGLRQRLIEYFQLAADRVDACPNLLDLDRLDQRATEFEPEIPADRFLIVTAGRLHPQKGHRDLLKAVDELIHRRGRSVRLVVLGTGELLTELQQFVQQHNLTDHVTFPGFVANPLPWFRTSRLFVLPSLYEGSPNALLEAVAVGTPALSTDCPSGPHEILEGGRLGCLVPVADPTALAGAIAHAMDHYPEWQQRAIMARESVRTRYDAASGIQKLEVWLEHVVQQAATGGP